MAPCLMIITAALIHYQEVGFEFLHDLSWKSYLLIAFMSGSNLICDMLSMLSYRHCEASKLAIYSYLSTPLQFIYDTFIFFHPVYEM